MLMQKRGEPYRQTLVAPSRYVATPISNRPRLLLTTLQGRLGQRYIWAAQEPKSAKTGRWEMFWSMKEKSVKI
jgi:hypothetical protein